MVLFRRRAKSLDTRSTNSVKIWRWIWSGLHDLFLFNFSISFQAICFIIFILGRFTSVFLSRTGTSAYGSFVKTLRIFDFSLSSNFFEVSSFSPCKRGAKPVLVYSLLLTCDQNILGLLFNWIPISFEFSFWFANHCFKFVSGYGVCLPDISSIWDI